MMLFSKTCSFLAIAALSLTSYSKGLKAEDQIKIGLILPLSGPYAHFGEAGRAGIQLAEAELEKSKLEFIYEDSQFEANQALNSAIKLIEHDHVNALIVLGTPTSSAVLPYSLRNNIPTFIWSASGDLSKQYKNSIRLMSTGAEQGDVLAREATKRGYKKIALVASENGYSQAVIDGVSTSSINLKPISKIFYAPTQTDFNLEIIKLKRLKVDSIGICLNTGQIPTYLRQLHTLGYKGNLFGCNAISSPDVLKALAENKFTAWSADGKVGTDFAKKFTDKWPDTSGLWEAAGYYDAIHYIAKYGIDGMVGKCLDKSAFGTSCIKEGTQGKYLKYTLGVTLMRDMEFVRE